MSYRENLGGLCLVSGLLLEALLLVGPPEGQVDDQAVDDGVEMVGYCTWAAIDLYSTREGFGKRYGFVYIDADHDFKRIKKDSFDWYRKVIATNGADLTD